MIFYSPSIDDTYNLIVLVCIMFNNKITVLDDVWYHLVVSFVTDVQYHLVGLDLPDPAVVPTRPGGCSIRAVGLDLQSRPIGYKDFQSAGQQ